MHAKSLQAHALRSLIIAREKLVGQRVTLENQIQAWPSCSGSGCLARSPQPSSIRLSGQARGSPVLCSHAGIDYGTNPVCRVRSTIDMRRMTRASAACRRLMTIPGVGQLTALAFVAAIDEPRASADPETSAPLWDWSPRRYQSGEVDYVGSISKCGDRRVRTLLYEAANVMLTRYKGQLKLKAFAYQRSPGDQRCAKRESLWRAARVIMHAMLRDETEFGIGLSRQSTRQEAESSSQEERRPREGADDGADFVAGQPLATAISTEPRCTQLTPSRAKGARRERRHPTASTPEELPPLTH